MKRRNFVLATLLSIPAVAFAKFEDFKISKRPKKCVLIRANESRFDGQQETVKDAIGRFLVSGADTDGELLIVAPGEKNFAFKGGPLLHIHKKPGRNIFCG